MEIKPIDKMDIIVWDIETIPSKTDDTPIKDSKINEKVDRRISDINNKKSEVELQNLVMSTNPFFGQIIVIASYEISKRYPNGLKRVFKLDPRSGIKIAEARLIENWHTYIATFTGSFVGFNSLNFDAYFLMVRSMYHKIHPKNKNIFNLKKFGSWPHYDIMQHLGNWGFDTRPSLEQVSEFNDIPSPKTGEIKADNVYKAYLDGRIDEIAEYCLKDVIATYELFKITSKFI